MIRPDFRELKAICNSENELLHYGIKGMKWGVRKSRRIYKNTGRKKKPGKRQLKRLNYAQKGMEYNIENQRIYNKQRPSKNKIINSYRKVRDKTIQGRMEKYSKKFDKYLNMFEEAGVDLSVRDATLWLGGNEYWVGKEYYIKNK